MIIVSLVSSLFLCLFIVFMLTVIVREKRANVAEQKQLNNEVLLPSVNSSALAKEMHEKTEINVGLGDGYKYATDQKLFIPTINDVREQGYPKNDNGETYGPDVKELDNADLILVQFGDGYGYIRQSDMDDDGVKSPEDAVEKMKEGGSRKINIYLQDGITCIGIFELKG